MKKKQPKQEILPPISIAERTGKSKNGGTFSIKVAVAGITVNGQEVSSELAADIIAGMLAEAVGEEED